MKRILFYLLLATPYSLFSQEEDSSQLEPVEVRAIRAQTMAPFAKTNLNRKDISRQNLGQDLPFLLNQTPSVVVSSDAGNGVGYTGIRIRGTDATRINVTLNGIPYNDAESQGSFFVDMPDFASSAGSIQIQRGVGTSTNGAGAFGATINISSNEINREAYIEGANSYGSFNTLKNTLRAGTGLLKDHFTADLRLSRISSDGYIDRATSNLRSLYFSTAYLSRRTDLRFNFISGKEKTYQAWNGVSETDLQVNRRINYAGMEKPGSPYENETDNYLQNHYQLFITQKFSSKLHFNVAGFLTHGSGYYEQYKADEDYADYRMPYPITGPDTVYTTDLVRQLWLHNHFYGSIFSLIYRSEKNSLSIGGAVTRYEGDHFGKVIWTHKQNTATGNWYDNNAFKNDRNIYSKWQHDLLPTLQTFIDLQYRYVEYQISGFRDNPVLNSNNRYGFLNPKLGLSYHKNHWLAYASYSIAGKEPNRDDFETGMDQQPLPEYLHDLELGIERRNSKRTWSANVYYMRYRNQLVLTGKINDVGAYTRTNIPDSYRLGLELQGSAQWKTWLRSSANLTISRNRIKSFTEFIDDYDAGGQKEKNHGETAISFSPAITGSGSLTFLPLKNFEISWLGKFVGKQYLDNTSDRNRMLDAYFTQDLQLAYSFSRKALKSAEAIFQVYNLFNVMYEPNGYSFSYYYNSKLTTENFYFPMAGINCMAGIIFRF